MCRFKLICSIIVVLIGMAAGQENVAFVNGSCNTKYYGYGSQVCVCTTSHCGALFTASRTAPFASDRTDGFVLYTTSRAGLRFHKSAGIFVQTKANQGDLKDESGVNKIWRQNGAELVVDPKTTYQEIRGFGGSMTDSAAINIGSLDADLREVLMKLLFSIEGNNYNLVRVPIGGTDDSTRKYTYADTPNDLNLEHFQLAEEDLKYKIPVIRKALEVTEGKLSLICSAWTAPPWMKSNNKYVNGVLKNEFYQLWADYHIKFLEEYAKSNLTFWAMTTGNEPLNGYFFYLVRFNSMGWTPWSHRQWLGHHLGPTLRSSVFNNTLILAHDDQRFLLPWWMDVVMRDDMAAKYVDGIAIHWYWDIVDPGIGLEATHNHFPDKFILSSEASNADKPWHLQKVRLGSWSRAIKYMDDIITVTGDRRIQEACAADDFNDLVQDLSHWVTGWMEWSMVLDTAGGPSWSGNYVDVGTIVNASSQEILLQPTYFALGHFSRFVVPGSKRVAVTGSPRGVDYVGFLTPAGQLVVVMHNKGNEETFVSVRQPGTGRAVLLLPANSFNTLLFNAQNK